MNKIDYVNAAVICCRVIM